MGGSLPEILLLFSGGLLAGALGGLLGIGGGIVLMPLLRFVALLPPAYAAGTCVVAVFFTTLGGSYRHYRLGNINFRSIAPVVISGAIASAVFSFLFIYLASQDQWLDLGVGIVFCLISVRMICEGIPGLLKKKAAQSTGNQLGGRLLQKTSIGAVAGILPGLLGIGTGGILVPAFNFLLGTPVKIAVAASLACFCINAFISSTFKLAQGFICLEVVVPICIGTLLGSNLGAILNRRFSSGLVKLLFGLVFGSVAVKFILSFCMVNS